MLMKVVLLDGSNFVGRRGPKEIGWLFPKETKGTHHFTVLEGDSTFQSLVGNEVAVPISSVKYFVMR